MPKGVPELAGGGVKLNPGISLPVNLGGGIVRRNRLPTFRATLVFRDFLRPDEWVELFDLNQVAPPIEPEPPLGFFIGRNFRLEDDDE